MRLASQTLEIPTSPQLASVLTLRLFGVADDSIVDGPGLRFAVFVQGCSHHCPGCHNPQALDSAGGQETSVAALWRQICANPLLSGITLSGGEPFEQPEPLLELAQLAKAQGLNVWAYSGYLYEQLLAARPSPHARELLLACDVLVDGPYVTELASQDLKWRGSANQRVIDIAASLQSSQVVQLEL